MANAKTKHAKKIQDTNARPLVGKKVLYLGNLVCPICGREQKRGMASLYKDIFYCNESCVLRVANG